MHKVRAVFVNLSRTFFLTRQMLKINLSIAILCLLLLALCEVSDPAGFDALSELAASFEVLPRNIAELMEVRPAELLKKVTDNELLEADTPEVKITEHEPIHATEWESERNESNARDQLTELNLGSGEISELEPTHDPTKLLENQNPIEGTAERYRDYSFLERIVDFLNEEEPEKDIAYPEPTEPYNPEPEPTEPYIPEPENEYPALPPNEEIASDTTANVTKTDLRIIYLDLDNSDEEDDDEEEEEEPGKLKKLFSFLLLNESMPIQLDNHTSDFVEDEPEAVEQTPSDFKHRNISRNATSPRFAPDQGRYRNYTRANRTSWNYDVQKSSLASRTALGTATVLAAVVIYMALG